MLTLNIVTGAVSDIAALNEPRFGHTSTVIKDNVYVVAGWNEGKTCAKSIELFNNDRWTCA